MSQSAKEPDPDNQGISDRDDLGRFAPGQSGNPAGRPRGNTLSEAVRKTLNGEKVTGKWGTLARSIVRKASTDSAFMKELWARLEGKVPDRVEHSGPDGNAIRIRADAGDVRRKLAESIASGAAIPESGSGAIDRGDDG